MCNTNRNWKSLKIKESSDRRTLKITAVRSDDFILSRSIPIFREDKDVVSVELVKSAINNLESYRNCKCAPLAFCEEHKK